MYNFWKLLCPSKSPHYSLLMASSNEDFGCVSDRIPLIVNLTRAIWFCSPSILSTPFAEAIGVVLWNVDLTGYFPLLAITKA